MNKQDGHLYEFGPFRLDTAEQLLLHEGRPVPLAGKAFETLVVLVRRSGQLVHKEELMGEVWPDTIVEENNLDKSISALRKALGEGDAERKYIETVRGRGYRFAAGVRELSAVVLVKERTLSSITIEEEEEIDRDETVGQELCVTASTVNDSRLDLIKPAPLPTGRMIATGRSFVNRIKRSSKIVSVLAVVFIVALAVTGYYVYSNRSDSIAVLPFTYTNADPNANSNPDSEYLSDGITENIINNLSRLPGLKVIARSSVFHYKGQEVDPQVVGRELGVRTVLTGRIIQQGDGLTIKVDLEDVRDNRHIWGEEYHRQIRELIAVQNEISGEVAGNLRAKLLSNGRESQTQRSEYNPEAYQLYLKGRYFWNKRTDEDTAKAFDYFQQAIDRDPAFAPAYAGLADCYLLGAGNLSGAESRLRAEAAARRALEIDEGIAEAHASLARVYHDGLNWAAAAREYRRAIELNPNYATAHHWYALYLSLMKQFDESVVEINRARELDPLSMIINANVVRILYQARRYDEAIEEGHKAAQLFPQAEQPHFYLGWVNDSKGNYDEAIAEYQKAISLAGDNEPHVKACLAHAYAMSGKRDEALKILNESLELYKRSPNSIWTHEIAFIYAGLGDRDKAFEWLEGSVETVGAPANFGVDPRWDSLRSDARFAVLLKRMNIPQ